MGEACGICAKHGLETENHGWTIWSGYGASGVPGKYVIAWDTNTHEKLLTRGRLLSVNLGWLYGGI
jgi:hypothetical protein